MIRLYNTLTRTIEPLENTKQPIKLYTCGPTVYSYYHIGNLRNAIFNDTLRRSLEADDYEVSHVMNITDVGHLVSDEDEGEDKLEKGAKREGKTVWEVAEFYTAAFKHDMQALNVLPPNGYRSKKYGDTYARATEFIDQQIEMVQLLLDKGYAYQTEQAIYFEVSKLADYGILSGQRLSDKETASRETVITDSSKHSPHDFAVWFFAVGHFADHTMQWESPWGSGFPGWHLECSAIIHATLGDPIDIHTGGVDHIGTHHPNEMAQTEAAYGHPLSHIWLHNEYLLVDGAKMSKSKDNSYLLKDITDKGFEPAAYRLLVLQAHYRTELNFSWDNLTAAKNRLASYQAMADLRFQPQKSGVDSATLEIVSLHKALLDDLNTPEFLAQLSEVESKLADEGIANKDIPVFNTLLTYIDRVLGLELTSSVDITDDQKQLIAKRQQAREAKDWQTADAVRNQLESLGIVIRDAKSGPVWNRI